MTAFFITVFLVALFSTVWGKKDFFSPVRLYIFAYSFYLAINSLLLSRLQIPWSSTTHMLFWGATFLFIAGGILVAMAHRIKNPSYKPDFSAVRESIQQNAREVDWDWFVRVWFFCIGLYLVSYAVGVLQIGKIPIFSESPDDDRLKLLTSNMFTGVGIYFGPLSLMMGSELVLFAHLTGRRKKICYCLLVIVFALYFSIVTRVELLRFVVFTMILYHYGRKNLGLPQLGLFFLCGAALFAGIFLIKIGSINAIGEINRMVALRMPAKFLWASQIYSYIAANFWNMDFGFRKFIDNFNYHPQSWGFELFRSLFFLLRLETPMEYTFGFDGIFNASIMKVSGYNSTVFLWHFYKDFGTFGAFFQTFVFGLLLAILYQNSMSKPTLFRICLWAIMVNIIILSITAPLWAFWFTHMNILMLAIAHKKLSIGLSAKRG
jgi:oligosaccharide repeat unit polymerase